jgi:hypothetical protein
MQRRLIYISTILFTFLLIIGCARTDLKDYVPKSPDEEAIVSLIISYEKAYNSKDIQGCKDLFSEEGKNMWGPNRTIFTKAEFDTILPTQMAEYPIIKFQELVHIEVSGMYAKVSIIQTYSASSGSPGIIHFWIECVKENQQWLLNSMKF